MTAYSDAIDAIETLFARSTPPQIRPEEVSTVIVDVAEALKAEIDAVPGGGGGGGSVATDTIFDAKGDLAVGTGSDTAARLAVGSNGQVLTADSGEATGLKWTTVAGTGDVTAASSFSTDNVLVRSDGTGKGVQATGITVADTTNDMSGVGALSCSTIELGHASDTTLARSGAGNLTVEGKALYRADGTDVALADGGTGASLSDPGADRVLFWDDSASAVTWLTIGSGLTITDTTISASGGSGLTVGSSSITGGTSTRVLYNNAGTLGEYTISGSGSVAMTTSPSFTTPALGTPSAGVLTSCTGLPASTGIAGLGTGVATALAVNVGSAGAFVTFDGALGTPSSGTLSSCTAATTSARGVVELATTAEYRTGTDTARALVVDQVWSAGALVALTNGSSIAVDMSTGINFSLTIDTGGVHTLSNPTNTKVGQTGCIVVTQDATGGRTLSYGTNWEFAGGSAPTLSTGANAKDVLFYWVQSSTSIIITGILKALA